MAVTNPSARSNRKVVVVCGAWLARGSSSVSAQNFSRNSKRKSFTEGKVPRIASLRSPPGTSIRMQSCDR